MKFPCNDGNAYKEINQSGDPHGPTELVCFTWYELCAWFHMANSHRRSQLGPGASVPTQNFDALIPSHKIWKRLSQDPLKKKKQLINLQPHPQYYDFSSPKIIKKKCGKILISKESHPMSLELFLRIRNIKSTFNNQNLFFVIKNKKI